MLLLKNPDYKLRYPSLRFTLIKYITKIYQNFCKDTSQ